MNRPKRIRFWVLAIGLVTVLVVILATANPSREPEFIRRLGGQIVGDAQVYGRHFPPGIWIRRYRFNASYQTVLQAMKTDIALKGWKSIESETIIGNSARLKGFSFSKGDEYFDVSDRNDLAPGTVEVDQCYKPTWFDLQIKALRQRLGI